MTQRGSTTRTVNPALPHRAGRLEHGGRRGADGDHQHVDVGVGRGLGEDVDSADAAQGRQVVAERRLGVAQHGRAVGVGDRLAQFGPQASARRAARRSACPGTMPSSARSHMPLWLAPSSPVRPARSSTTVTGSRCSATSIISWSKARLRNVA